MFKEGLDFSSPRIGVSPEKLEKYEKAFQVFAFWCDDQKSPEENRRDFFCGIPYFLRCIESCPGMTLCKSGADVKNTGARTGALLAVEGAGLFTDHPEDLDAAYALGVRDLIPVWGGEDGIGGAWDTSAGLTPFGKALCRRADDLGMILDVSHASEKTFYDLLSLSHTGRLMASHSNSRAVCDTPRNLADREFGLLRDGGGIVGISLAAKHISEKYTHRMPLPEEDFPGDVLRHILHYLGQGGENTVCLGCDFDGTEPTPHFPDVSAMSLLYGRLLSEGVGRTAADKIFFGNAFRFFSERL